MAKELALLAARAEYERLKSEAEQGLWIARYAVLGLNFQRAIALWGEANAEAKFGKDELQKLDAAIDEANEITSDDAARQARQRALESAIERQFEAEMEVVEAVRRAHRVNAQLLDPPDKE